MNIRKVITLAMNALMDYRSRLWRQKAPKEEMDATAELWQILHDYRERYLSYLEDDNEV